jgi:hypothetical protein
MGLDMGMGTAELANRLGVSKRIARHILRGERKMSYSQSKRFAMGPINPDSFSKSDLFAELLEVAAGPRR